MFHNNCGVSLWFLFIFIYEFLAGGHDLYSVSLGSVSWRSKKSLLAKVRREKNPSTAPRDVAT